MAGTRGHCSQYRDLVVTLDDSGVRTIRLNAPARKNAIRVDTYRHLAQALEESDADDRTRVTVVTGTGDYFSSGNDISNLFDAPEGESASANFGRFVEALIDHDKILAVLVNGDAIGIAVTMLGLADAIFAVDDARLSTPFAQLGLVAEACSTFTFPKIIGHARSMDLFCMDRKLSGKEAEQIGLVTRSFPRKTFEQQATEALRRLAGLPQKSLTATKSLMRRSEKSELRRINQMESETLMEVAASQETMEAAMKFLERKKRPYQQSKL